MTILVKKLSTFCKTSSGGTPSRSNNAFFENGTIPWVKSGELKNRYITNVEEYITDIAVEKSSAKLVSKGSILIAMYGATVGEVSQLTFDATTNQAICSILPDQKVCDVNYLYRFLEASKPYLLTRRVGGGQPNISQAVIKDLEVPLPPLNEQRRIASILEKADELRQKRQQAIEKLDQLLQATFIDMFGDPISNPKGWDVGCIGDMLESVKYGSSDKATLEGEIPILRMNNLTYSGEMDLTDLKYITKVQADEKYLVKEGDILFNRTNSKELVGKTAVYVGPEPMAYAGYLVRARTKANYAPEYISAFLNSPWGKEKLQSMCKSIVGMANINAKEFQSIVLPIPPENEQIQFKNKVLTIREKKRLLINQLSILDTLFKSLQNQAFSGNL
ncbi:TPA: restriction endonuclease subunit S [Acinetobacter baumannii]|uniref:restriction endonuclease subunit S n=1 Tax=Acinetobacter baumannii TaxID=470 RepID=UPI00081078F0|nr:restriction endonuclease subunit S [Acinetobacter baumannii]MBK4747614.1 Type-1 restriction enzyme EcoKI specificity protein [Acinetobacter baumannii]MDC5118911.1 restriction endonuclease subunit S [Acinetobacter baumannii]OOD21958.1 type I restriction endonuclease subunit R [Acinetobacter baumannii]RDJ47103.1 type I restriction modification enzyme protein S [Acinetobacter baumannii]TKV57189.1 restriction endonuclease subunit S [Acinetobacter baumannii]